MFLYANSGSDPTATLRLGKQWMGPSPAPEANKYGGGAHVIENNSVGFSLFSNENKNISCVDKLKIYAAKGFNIETDQTYFKVDPDGYREILEVDENIVKRGSSSEVFVGAKHETFLGTRLELSVSAAVEIFLGLKFELQAGYRFEADLAGVFEWSPEKKKFIPAEFEANAEKAEIVGNLATLAASVVKFHSTQAEINGNFQK